MLEFQTFANSIFLISIPVLVTLYMLKLKRQNRKFPNVYFLKQIVSESRGSSLLKKLSANMLLFLEIMFLLFLCIALLSPFIPGRSFHQKKIAVIIDNSITMSAYEPELNASRLEIALNEAAEFVSNNYASEFTIVCASENPALIGGKLTAQEALEILKNKIFITHYKAELTGAIAIAEGFLEAGKNNEIYLFSDFSSKCSDNAVTAGKSGIIYRKIGSSVKNIGITALEIASENETGSACYNIFFTVRNYSPFEISIPVTVAIAGNVIYSSVFTIAKNSSESKILRQYGNVPRDVRVEIRPEDYLQADNVMQSGYNSSKNFKVLLISDNPYFYKSALESISDVTLTITEKNVPRAIYRSREADLAIIDDTGEIEQYQKYQASNFIFIRPESGVMGLKISGERFNLSFKPAAQPFEYMANVDLSGLYVSRMPFISSAGEFGEIVYSDNSVALFLRAFTAGHNYFVFAFDPLFSNLPLKVAFPVLLGNIINICRQNNSEIKRFEAGGEIWLKDCLDDSKKSFIETGAGKILYLKNMQSGDIKEVGMLSGDIISNAGTKLPIISTGGDYLLYFNDNSGNTNELGNFYVNCPPKADLDITPGRYFQKNGADASKNAAAANNKNGYDIVARDNLSFSPFFIFIAVIILLIDWIYQNHRLLWKKAGDKND